MLGVNFIDEDEACDYPQKAHKIYISGKEFLERAALFSYIHPSGSLLHE